MTYQGIPFRCAGAEVTRLGSGRCAARAQSAVQPPSTGRAGEVVGLRIGQHEGGAGEFGRLRPATHRDLGIEETLHLWVIVDAMVEWRSERARSQRVDRDAGPGNSTARLAVT
jgi:hypothetical protein